MMVGQGHANAAVGLVLLAETLLKEVVPSYSEKFCSLEEEDVGHRLVEESLLVMMGQGIANAAEKLVLLRYGLMMGKQMTVTSAAAGLVVLRHALMIGKKTMATKAGG